MAKPKKTNKAAVTWAQAFRDIINKAMDRGQLLPILFFFIFMFFIYRMPSENVYEFGMNIVQGFKDLSLLGWGTTVLVSILWAGHARIMRRKHSAEYLRIGGEKSKLQQDKAKPTLGSSDSF